MPHHSQQHLHKRQRIQKKTLSYPHPDPRIRFLDRICVFFSVLMPMTALPQIYKLYYFQDGSGLSIWMWILYFLGVIPFLLYGIVHKVSHLVVLNILWIIAQTIMIIGIILYG
jgi:MtN3 and saliva related transmembrane protein